VDNPLAALQAALAGRYRLEHQVGQGGMGFVYLAHDLKHDRAVAIKVLRPEVAALLGPERFLREIGIAAQLNHPHIVPLHDSGEAGGHLFYVMPFISGETLRERLTREHHLPLDDALHITRQVASALTHAHGRGVVHRDIKPSNILLNEGFALVADFGLARALPRASDTDEISSIGLPIGTPRYMSPEQALGASTIDGRSDLYSLGRVLYEMLTGAHPDDTEALLRTPSDPGRAATAPERLPTTVQRALRKCLASDPANRFATAEAFVEELGRSPARDTGRRWMRVAAAVGIVIVAAWGLSRVTDAGRSGVHDAALDTTRIAVLPFDRLPGAPEFPAEVPVRAALGRWTGISLVAGVQVSEALKGRSSGAIDRGVASRIARDAGAGRFVRGQVVPFGDSVQVEAVLYDSRDGTALVEKSARLPRDLAGAESIVTRLVDSLLFRGAMPVEHFDAPAGTTSVPAMWGFIEGRNAVDRWDLAAADSGFGKALRHDPTFTRAALWLAQVRVWQAQPTVTWRSAATQAAAGAARLAPRDAAITGLLEEMSRGEYGSACPRFLELTRQWPNEFPVWYGTATCMSRDGAVVRDPKSPTAWRFRTSYHQVQRAWRRAFALMPAIYRDFRSGGLSSTQMLLWTATNRGRSGSAVAPDTGFFMSYPTWEGDSLAFFPRRLADFTLARAVRPEATREAVTRQRLAFYELATEWASADSRSWEAREAVALALWSLGNPAAIDSIRATRGQVRSPHDRVRLGLSEALMRVLAGAPDPTATRAARAIADSALAMGPVPHEADSWDLATLAALTGRGSLAAELIRRASPRMSRRLPPALTADALALLAFAALGGPGDSVTVLERRVSDGITAGVEAGRRAAARSEWLGRPSTLVVPELALPSIRELAGTGDYLIDAAAAYAAGDHTNMMRLLRRAEGSRKGSQASDLDFEAIFPEARILAAVGEHRAAISRLDPTLSDLRHMSLQLVNSPMGAALLVRAMALRADLAMTVGDSANARKWARPVALLWSNADPFLEPLVQRMRRIIDGGNP
jgi:hypothetical protein